MLFVTEAGKPGGVVRVYSDDPKQLVDFAAAAKLPIDTSGRVPCVRMLREEADEFSADPPTGLPLFRPALVVAVGRIRAAALKHKWAAKHKCVPPQDSAADFRKVV